MDAKIFFLRPNPTHRLQKQSPDHMRSSEAAEVFSLASAKQKATEQFIHRLWSEGESFAGGFSRIRIRQSQRARAPFFKF